MTKSCVLLATACAAALMAGCAASPSPSGIATAAPAAVPGADGRAGQVAGASWTYERSDVTPDPAVRYGYLPNGMKYALRRNATPPGQAALRLHIDAGSLMERDDQLGLAHFMEHMIFNGTKNVPEGEFTRRLERLGLAFGADTNASTNFDETIYSLDLPRTNDETVDTALLLFRETAGEALLEAGAIDRERGVVLSEERMGASPGFRAVRAQYEFLMKGQLPPKRFPIGTTEILRTAPRERFVEFYNAWYRPENATLIAVGDFDLNAMEAKIRARFADWRGRGPAGVAPKLGAVAERGTEVGVYVEPGASSSVALAWTTAPELETDSMAERRETWHETLAASVLNRRLSRLTLAANPPFTQATMTHVTALDAIGMTSIDALFASGGWKRALEAVEREQRRAVQYGVTQAELDRAIRTTRAGLVNAVAGANTQSSFQLATNILTGVSRDDVVTTPVTRLAQFDEFTRGLTAARVSEVIRGLFQGGGPLVFVASPAPIADAERTVAQAFAASRQVAVTPPVAAPDKAWAYASFGAPGRVVERREIADLQTTFVRFDNGVRLTVRPSRDDENSIQIRVRVGDGELDLDRDRPSPAWALRPAFVEGGLGKMTLEEIDDALVGRSYSVNPSIGEDNFALDGSTQPKDLATQMQVLAAFATDPGYRPLGLERARSLADDTYKQALTSPAGMLGLKVPRYLRPGDQRVGLPPLAAMQATTIADVRRALSPITTEPIEVVIAGDVTLDEAIARTAETFGALPARRETGFPPGAARIGFPAGSTTPVRLVHEGRADQSMAMIAWPTDDIFSDPQKARTASMLARVMQLRLTDELREKQGATYSPGVGNQASRVYPGYGYLNAIIETPPERLNGFFTDVGKIARELRDTPATPDELDRARRPALEALARTKKSNGYWLGALSGAQRDPRRLEWIRQSAAGMERVTPVDIQQVAREYLRDERAFRIVAVPAPVKSAANRRP